MADQVCRLSCLTRRFLRPKEFPARVGFWPLPAIMAPKSVLRCFTVSILIFVCDSFAVAPVRAPELAWLRGSEQCFAAAGILRPRATSCGAEQGRVRNRRFTGVLGCLSRDAGYAGLEPLRELLTLGAEDSGNLSLGALETRLAGALERICLEVLPMASNRILSHIRLPLCGSGIPAGSPSTPSHRISAVQRPGGSVAAEAHG